jgi:hypothetical protein
LFRLLFYTIVLFNILNNNFIELIIICFKEFNWVNLVILAFCWVKNITKSRRFYLDFWKLWIEKIVTNLNARIIFIIFYQNLLKWVERSLIYLYLFVLFTINAVWLNNLIWDFDSQFFFRLNLLSIFWFYIFYKKLTLSDCNLMILLLFYLLQLYQFKLFICCTLLMSLQDFTKLFFIFYLF